MVIPAIRRISQAILATVLLMTMVGCGSTNSTPSATGDTKVPHKLTIATGQPAWSPWVENNDPASGKGFEAAVAYAVAKKMGYSKENVIWVRSGFDAAIAPGKKDFDLNIQQFSANEQRRKAVDFSEPYYVTSQAVVSIKGNKVANAKNIADLKNTKIGVAAGSTSIGVVKKIIGTDPQIFNSTEDAAQALRTHVVDSIVTDLPTSFALANSNLKKDGGVLVGQLEDTKDGDKLAFLLPKGSSLTPKVNKAISELTKDGTLKKLADEWIADKAGAKILK